MKLSYFEDTDTLYIELKNTDINDSRDFDENTLLDVDLKGNILAITVEHASSRADVRNITLSGFAAWKTEKKEYAVGD